MRGTDDLPRPLRDALAEAAPTDDDEDRLGPLAEGHLGRSQRVALGQFFTPTPLVDLVLSFCVRRGDARVLDPSCGTGAFLVRALARKRVLAPGRSPETLADEILGVDRAALPARLARINLERRLGPTAVPPRVVESDFFDVPPPGAGSDGSPAPVDAVVGNPPWVQQESLPARGSAAKGHTKETLRRIVSDGIGCELSGRSDLHAYFWPAAGRFLLPRGRLGFVTSAQWLDAGYGDALREWLLRSFEVEAILESVAEPWFPGARVDSTVTILRRSPSPGADAPVRLVQLRRPLAEWMRHDGSARGAVTAADALRDAVLGPTGDVDDRDIRLRIVSQKKLSSPPSASGHPTPRAWGRLLREPTVWRRLRDLSRGRWLALGDRGTVRRGITSGCDAFFYVKDIEPADGPFRTVRCTLDGSDHRIEARALAPLIHGPLELDRLDLRQQDPSRWVLWARGPRDRAEHPGLDAFLNHGERLGIHRRPTCAARTSARRPWYDLTRPRQANLLWPKERQFRHLVARNPDAAVANCRLYEIGPPAAADLDLWAGVLNSSWTLLSCLVHGRPVGSEAVWSTMVGEVRAMPIPDPDRATPVVRSRIGAALETLAARPVLSLLPGSSSELRRADRRALDDAVLELLGIDDGGHRDALLDRLHDHLDGHFGRLRRKEARAIAGKRRPG